MKAVDANALLYAVNVDAGHHEASRTWLDNALSGADTVGLTWSALLAFVRIATKIGLYPQPLTVDRATRMVGDWIAAPGAHVIHPAEPHLRILERLLRQVGTGGNLVTNAHRAAIAVERRCEVVSYDTDFARFSEVRWVTPDDLNGR